MLFDLMQQLGENPDDVDLLNKNRDVYRDHFDYEEKQFMACGEPCDADAHKKKHDIFFKTLTWVTNPVSQEYLEWAKNWLAQHIKNTDFKYKYKLATHHKVPEPYVWNNEFEVFVSIQVSLCSSYMDITYSTRGWMRSTRDCSRRCFLLSTILMTRTRWKNFKS